MHLVVVPFPPLLFFFLFWFLAFFSNLDIYIFYHICLSRGLASTHPSQLKKIPFPTLFLNFFGIICRRGYGISL